MKEIKAQISSDILRNIIPLNAIDASREALTPKESESLFDMWKNGKAEGTKLRAPANHDRIVLSMLKQKGYLQYDGATVEFTKRGREAIKVLILSKDENALKKKGN